MADPAVNSRAASSNRTSPALLDKVRQNDRGAWDKLVNLYAPLVYYWCKHAGLQQTDAEEVGQKVFLAMLRDLSTRTRGGGSFRGWLRQMTRRKIVDHAARSEGRIGGSSAQEPPANVEAAAEEPASISLEKNILYRRAIELLEDCIEPCTRRAFWLLLSGQHATDVATELKMSLGAVYTARSRVLRRIREEFGDVLDFGPPVGPAD